MNKEQPKDGSSKKFISCVCPKDDEPADKFYRINSLPEKFRDMIIQMMLDGKSSYSIAGELQKFGYNQDMTRLALSALLNKYKAENGDTPLIAIQAENMSPEQRTRHYKAMLHYEDLLNKSAEIIKKDYAKLDKLARKERATGIHDKSINIIALRLSSQSKKYADIILRLYGRKALLPEDYKIK